MKRVSRRSWSVVACCLALSSCTTFDQARACQSFGETINPVLEEVQAKADQAPVSDPPLLRSQAGRYRALASQLEAQKTTLAPLGNSGPLFALEFRQVAAALDDAANAQEGSLPNRYRIARSRLESSTNRLRDLKKQLSRRCG